MDKETGKLSFDKLFLLSGVYALFYTFCLYRNRMGLTFPVFALGTAGLFLYYLRLTGRALKKGSALYLAGILLLGLNVCLTSNEIVILFDKGFIFLLFFMLFLHNLYDDSTWDVSKYILSLCGCVLSAVKFLPRPLKDLGEYLKGRSVKTTSGVVCREAGADTISEAEATSGVVCRESGVEAISEAETNSGAEATSGVICREAGAETTSEAEATSGVVCREAGVKATPEVTSLSEVKTTPDLPLLAVILPLLMSSDVIFMDFFENMFDLGIEIDPGAILFMIFAVFVMSYGMLCRFGQPMKYAAAPVTDKRRYSPVIAITVNLVLLSVYFVYCGIQVIYLFMRQGTLPEGYTYSSYAHEGFFQLVFVCLINILIVLLCRKYSADNLALKCILCLISACTYVLIASAAYRMFLYIGVYKLTFLRLYVLWALAVMAVVMAGIIVYLFRPGMPFARFAACVLVSLWMIFAYAKPDYLIAAYNIQYHDDDSYIMRLSFDAVPAIEKYDKSGELLTDYFKYGDYPYYESTRAGGALQGRKVSLRKWNYSLHRTYRIYEAHREELERNDLDLNDLDLWGSLSPAGVN